jgi:hypothetical protein
VVALPYILVAANEAALGKRPVKTHGKSAWWNGRECFD